MEIEVHEYSRYKFIFGLFLKFRKSIIQEKKEDLQSFIHSAHSETSTLLIPAVCRTRVKYEPSIQLFRKRMSEKICTRQSRKVIWDIIITLFLTL